MSLLLLIPFRWVQGTQTTLTGPGSPVAGIDQAGARGMLALILMTAGLVFMSRWSIAGDGFGGRWVQAANPVARFVRATVLVVAIAWGAGLLRNLAESLAGSSPGGTSALWQGYSAADRVLTGAFAGSSEETLDVAVLTGVAFAIATALSRWRVRRGRPALSSRMLWVAAFAAALIGLVTRYTDHLYQAGLGSAFALVWGAGFLAVFAVYRSVLPLMLGHFIFDGFIAGNPALPNAWGPYLVVFAVVIGGAFAASYVPLSRRQRLSGG
ncbi:MAG: hypothetical protein ABI067_01055 [Leifsonia sp.]